MSLNIKDKNAIDGRRQVAGGAMESLRYISGGDGINVNNDPSSEDYKKITNTGVISVIESPDTKEESGEDKYDNGTILVQTGIESEDNPPVPVKVKGINTAAFMPIEKELTEDSDDVIPTSKAVADFVLDNTDSNTWIGTKADYEKEKDDIETGTKVFITDDEGESAALIHANITGRDAADSHPMSAITGLTDALDNKVNKSETSSVDNTTRIVEVPEDVDCFGSVAMIGGKTQKVVQLIYNGDETYTNSSQTDTRDWFNSVIMVDEDILGDWVSIRTTGVFKIVLRASADHTNFIIKHSGESKDVYIFDSSAPTYSGHVYVLSMNVTAYNPSIANGLKLNNIMLFDLTAMDISVSGTDDEIIGRLDSIVKNSYVPTGSYLWNAPVESIVSYVTYNPHIYDRKAYVATTGVMIDSINRSVTDKFDIPYDGFKLKVKATSVSGKNVTVNVISYNSKGVEAKTSGWLGSDVEYVLSKDYSKIAILLGYTPAAAIEYNDIVLECNLHKTELSLVDITKNLPDYGCGINDELYNYIDFERGIYIHNVGRITTEDLVNRINDTRVTVRKNSGSAYECGADDYPIKPDMIQLEDGVEVDDGEITLSNTFKKYGSIQTIWNHPYSFHSSWMSLNLDYDTKEKWIEYITTNNTEILYKLATPEEIPLTDVLPPFNIEPNGTIEFVNEHNLDVPSKTIYKKTV